MNLESKDRHSYLPITKSKNQLLKYCLLIFIWLITPTIYADDTVDLRVLVISTGMPSEDLGLDLIDDVLDKIGIPFDVLDSRRETLVPEKLSTGNHGFYNGIIVTDSQLYISDGVVGFTPDEWLILHTYERNFSVRESVLSGFPAGFPNYGLTNSGGGSSFTGTWLAPAGGNEIFEYINTANSFQVDDWAFLSRATGTDPQVQPLLVVRDEEEEEEEEEEERDILIALLNYADGREVLFSGITNAWYLIHSQALAYEFINFATKGVFIGGRHVYFAAHVDDFFTSDDLWNPETNMTEDDRTFRLSGADLENTIAIQSILNNQHSSLNSFKLDMAFNGQGALLPEDPTPNLLLPSIADTYIEQDDRWDNNGNKADGNIKYVSGSSKEERMLLKFNVPTDSINLASTAILSLWIDKLDTNTSTNDDDDDERDSTWSWSDRDDSDDRDESDDHDDSDDRDDREDENPSSTSNLDAKVCRIVANWREGNDRNYRNATWMTRRTWVRWSNRGGDYDANSCINFSLLNDGNLTVDITPIVNVWLSGQSPNYGLIILATNDGEATIYSREAATSQQPALDIAFNSSQNDSLVDAVLQNKTDFRYINHTFSHQNMDTSAGTTYDDAVDEIILNRNVWQDLDLPEYDENISVLVSGNHSGLKDENQTELDPTDDIQYPDGRNDEFLRAAEDTGVSYIASDSSQVNQNVEGYIPDRELILSPRRPSALFYNVTTPEEWTDEYNYLFYERFIEQDLNPCEIPGAICQPRNFEEILIAEADWTFRRLMEYQVWPNFFHQSNLRNYDGLGSTLLFDWLNAIISRYERVFNLPIKNLPYYKIGDLTRDRIAVRNTDINGVWNLTTNEITLTAGAEVNALITGISGGELYGGQSIQPISLGPTPQTFSIDRKLAE